jgi:hypothetical protein
MRQLPADVCGAELECASYRDLVHVFRSGPAGRGHRIEWDRCQKEKNNPYSHEWLPFHRVTSLAVELIKIAGIIFSQDVVQRLSASAASATETGLAKPLCHCRTSTCEKLTQLAEERQ